MKLANLFITLFSTAFCAMAAFAQGIDLPETLEDTAILIRDQLIAKDQYDEVIIAEDYSIVAMSDGEEKTVFYPDNLHKILSQIQDPEERLRALENHMNLMDQAAQNDVLTAETIDRVFPVIRHSDHGRSAPAGELISRPFVGDLAVFYVFDSPNTVQFLTQGQLDNAGISIDELYAAAQTNVARVARNVEIIEDTVGILKLDGYYENSLLVYDELWQQLAGKYENLIVIVPSRDLVVFVDGNLPQAMDYMRKTASELFQSRAGPVTDMLLRRTESGWVVVD